MESLEGADGTEEEELESEPLSWAESVEDRVGRECEKYDTQLEHLLADVGLVLLDADIFHEVVRDGVGDVTSVKFCDAMNCN